MKNFLKYRSEYCSISLQFVIKFTTPACLGDGQRLFSSEFTQVSWNYFACLGRTRNISLTLASVTPSNINSLNGDRTNAQHETTDSILKLKQSWNCKSLYFRCDFSFSDAVFEISYS